MKKYKITVDEDGTETVWYTFAQTKSDAAQGFPFTVLSVTEVPYDYPDEFTDHLKNIENYRVY